MAKFINNIKMIQDKISVILKDIASLRGKLKGIKSDIKHAEKIQTDEYRELEQALKDLKKQVKDYKESWLQELAAEEHYNKLREMRLETEEEIAQKNADLFEVLDQLPQKSHEMKVETEEGFININIQPEMKLYLNGREEKRRTS